MIRRVTKRLLIIALLLVAPAVEASPTFAAELQVRAHMPCLPRCTLCHRDNSGGRGTVSAPFGFNMQQLGLKAGDIRSLARALEALEAAEADGGAAGNSGNAGAAGASALSAMVDTDADGVGDLDELAAGTDPSSGADESVCSDLEYGCAASPVTHRRLLPAWSTGVASALALVISLGLRRRARRRR